MALGRVAFSLADLTAESGLSAVAAKYQLLRLRGKVARVSRRQPFFLIVGPEHRAMGAPPAIWWLQDYFTWLGHPYYLALQSAASSFASNPQALQVTQVMTDRPCRAIKLGRIQVRFFVKRGIERTPTQQLAQAVSPLCISTPEATAFDLIRYATSIGARRKELNGALRNTAPSHSNNRYAGRPDLDSTKTFCRFRSAFWPWDETRMAPMTNSSDSSPAPSHTFKQPWRRFAVLTF
jgi:hypothetical protein